jgi:N-ethylmaleimide reductase
MSSLFNPVDVGALKLEHRVVLAPLTRMRSKLPGNVPSDLMVEYYGQRASKGGLLVAEATFISPRGNGGYGSPGIATDQQADGWRRVVAAVHAKGAKIMLQLWHAGRQSHPDLGGDGGLPIAPSAIQTDVRALLADGPALAPMPQAMTREDIADTIADYTKAAARATAAGFDGVEIHAANGYLIDEFLQDNANRRTDEYGGSIENRTRFLRDVVEAVTAVWDADRVGVRIGPSNTFGEMGDSNPHVLFAHVARVLSTYGLAYLHIIEPRVRGNTEVGDQTPLAAAALKPLFGGPVIAAGGFDGAGAEAIVERGEADLVAFGRHFIANPDLPDRLRRGAALTPYDRSTFYYGGEKGYADYPFSSAAT